MLTPEAIWSALEDVKDPEIPVVSVVELGIVHEVRVDGRRVTVLLTPTFVGCPAVETMRQAVHDRLAAMGAAETEVRLTFDSPWTSDRISEAGRRKLREFGLAPPPRHAGLADFIQLLPASPCPQCGSLDTFLESPFGPTLCRAIHYCNACRQSFEQFKPL